MRSENASYRLLAALLILMASVLVHENSALGQPDTFRFRDVGEETGFLPAAAGIMGHGAGWGDVDGDGWPDLYVGTFHYTGYKPNMLLLNRKGRFELAEGGTLFLDEIGDMPLDMQVKILRVLQEKVFERVGGTKQIPSNVRIIAATHQNLEQMVEENQFRMDLFYRLNVFPIQTPSLKERPEDIPVLIDSIVDQFTEGGEPIRFDERAIQQLQHHNWEGNVRELLNLMERLSILYPEEEISLDKLPLPFVGDELAECRSEARVSELELLHDETVDLKTKIKNYEINFILKALEITSGNVSQAANKLSLQRTTLVEKIRKYDISYA